MNSFLSDANASFNAFLKEGEVRDAVDKIQNYNHSLGKENAFVSNYSIQLCLGSRNSSAEIIANLIAEVQSLRKRLADAGI